jgi:hypothetical protein
MAMRRILVNYARDRARLKRGGGAPAVGSGHRMPLLRRPDDRGDRGSPRHLAQHRLQRLADGPCLAPPRAGGMTPVLYSASEPP